MPWSFVPLERFASLAARRLILLPAMAVTMLALTLSQIALEIVRHGTAGLAATVKGWMYYTVAVLSANYIDAGFVRRGLGGAIARLFSPSPYLAGLMFHVFSALVLIAALIAFHQRHAKRLPRASLLFLAAFIVFSPQTFVGWANDIARTDMLVIGATVWAALALLSHRPFLAAATLFAASQVHETAIIFGGPLLLVLALSTPPAATHERRNQFLAGAALGLALVAITVLQSLTGPSVEELTAIMRARTPPPLADWYADLRDCAIYMLVAGFRGVRTAICYNDFYAAHFPLAIASIGIVAVNAAILGIERRVLAVVVAVVVPVVFMNYVASDMGRWLKFAAVSLWVLAVFHHGLGTVVLTRRRIIVSVALFAALMAMGASRVHHPNPVSAKIVTRLGYAPAPEVAEWMTHCDPDWRAIAAGARPAD